MIKFTHQINIVNRPFFIFQLGNHAFVSVINNFIPNSKVEYYAKIQGLEVEPKLPPNLVTPLHRLLISTNVHPIFVSLYLQRNSGLFDAASKISKVLEMMCERESKSPDPNEVLALKFHFLSYFVKSCSNLAATFQQNPKIKLEGPALLTNVMKYWLKGREEDGFPKALEELVRQGLREYPYHHQSLFQQLVRTLAPVRIGDEPTGIDLVTSTLCGRQMADAEDACSTCGEASMDSRPLRKCSVCKSVQYCGEVCQRLHWPGHKKQCPSLAKKTQKINADEKKCKFDVGTGDNPDVFQAQMTSSCNVTDTGLPAEVDPTPDGLSEENKPVSLSSGS